MMKKIIVNGNEYTFINEAESTRHGFKHTSSMYVNGFFDRKATVHYLNRTWESYPFKTAMLNAVDDALKDKRYEIELTLKEENGWKRLSKDRKETLECICNDDSEVQELKRVMEELR